MTKDLVKGQGRVYGSFMEVKQMPHTTKTFSRVDVLIYDSRGERLELKLKDKQFTAKQILTEVADWLATVTAPEDWITPEQVVVQSNPPLLQSAEPAPTTRVEDKSLVDPSDTTGEALP